MTIKKLSNARQSLKDIRDGQDLTFGKIIEAIRKSDGIAQSDFAKKMKISRAYLCDIEKGRRHVSASKAAEFAEILGYSPTHFVAIVIEEELKDAGLKMKIEIKEAA